MTIFEGYPGTLAGPGQFRNQADNFPCPVKVRDDEQEERKDQLPDIRYQISDITVFLKLLAGQSIFSL